ncbi:CopG family transcriptional regulator [Halomicroarcula sp. GCM10025709]|nr:CopG family transcriptional regulator [Halomicroarcula sp. YJ-61-S]
MPTRYTVVCDDDQSRVIETLARRYGITSEEVIQQLIESGLDDIENTPA